MTTAKTTKTSTTKTFELSNTVAFITGTNKERGIGRAIVNALLDSAVKKIYATARVKAQLDELVSTAPSRVVAVELDVTKEEETAKLGQLYPDVNLVINNAGFYTTSTSIADEIKGIRQEMEVNYFAPLAVVKSFAPVLEKSKTTTAVVNVASIASLVNFPLAGTYSASKAAAHSLTQAQRRDLPNTLVIGVYPGPIDTDMADGVPFEKAPASDVAKAVMEALKSGQEDVFPDPMSQQLLLFAGWKADAKALEQQMAAASSA